MEFEFDKRKSRINKNKHRVDFFEAQVLWNDPDRRKTESGFQITLIREEIGDVSKHIREFHDWSLNFLQFSTAQNFEGMQNHGNKKYFRG